MRKQLNGLIDFIRYSFQLDPYSNSLFLFCRKRADRIKAVHYERGGLCLFALWKRPPPMAAHRWRSQTALPSADPLAVGKSESGTAKSSLQMGSPKARETRKFLINTGKSCRFMVQWTYQSRKVFSPCRIQNRWSTKSRLISLPVNFMEQIRWRCLPLILKLPSHGCLLAARPKERGADGCSTGIS